jgi:hypothetical protein
MRRQANEDNEEVEGVLKIQWTRLPLKHSI